MYVSHLNFDLRDRDPDDFFTRYGKMVSAKMPSGQGFLETTYDAERRPRMRVTFFMNRKTR